MEPFENNSNKPHAPYKRPQLKWVCGHAREGCTTCPLGPTSKGACRSSGLCQPRHEGDRYYCTRSSTLGGKCTEGPLPDGRCAHIVPPCNPQLSTRALRGRICLAVTIATIALLIFLFSGKDGIQHASAGPLSSNHAAIAKNCSDCHEFGDLNHLSQDLLQLHARSHASSEKCLHCHNLGETPHNPHSLSPEKLALLKTQGQEDSTAAVNPHIALAAKLIGKGPQQGEETHCASCHTEHKGSGHDIQAMSNAQCQACHTNPSQAFTTGHPDFHQYPYERRTRINFDHQSHLQKHFNNPEYAGLGANDCLQCHQLDNKGALMKTKSYDLMCASCHTDQIEGKGQTGSLGYAFLQLPGIDTETLDQRGYPVGQWPEYADGGLSPFMQAILQCDPIGRSCLETLGSADWMDLRQADEKQLEAAQCLVWLIKDLIFMAVTENQQFLQDKILAEQSFTHSRPTQAKLSGKLPYDVLLAAQQAWLPNLFTEVPQYRNGILPQSTSPEPAEETPKAGPALTADDNDTDNLLNNEDNGDLLFDSDESLLDDSGDGDLLGGDSDGLLATEDELLSGDLLAPDDTILEDGLLSMDTDTSGDLLLSGGIENEDLLATENGLQQATPTEVEMKDPEEWSKNGGWYRSDSTYALYYRPTGHADAFLTEWLTLSAKEAHKSEGMQILFNRLSANQSPGLCSKCHSIDNQGDGTLAMNWRARDTEALQRRSTLFKHAPHFNNQGSAGCYLCHQFDNDSDYAAAFIENNDPHRFSSNFRDMNKALCAQCHNPDSKTDHCLHCHNYHVGTPNPKLPQNNFRSFITRKIEE